MEKKSNMIYRFMGKTGMQISVLGYGNMMFSKITPEIEDSCYNCIVKAYEGGVNFFDTAEIYGFGNAETILGKCLKKAAWARKDYVVTTKILRSGEGVNDCFLSRKHIIEGTTASLGRLQLDYVDVVYAHRYDFETPIEETCRAFNWLINHGKAFYWATSEWTPQQIMEAFECCERLGLAKPVADQAEYNLFSRQNVEADMSSMFEKYGYGTTVWSPLAGGYLTGKYNDGKLPEGSRYADPSFPKEDKDWVDARYISGDQEKFFKRLRALGDLAKELKCSQAQLCLAWCIANKDVSTAIVGASKPQQIEDNLGAVEVAKKWTPEIEKKIEEIMMNAPKPPFNWRNWQSFAPRRSTSVESAKP